MLNIFATRINTLTKDRFNYLLLYLDKEKKEKIQKYRYFADAQRSLLGEILVRYALEREYKIAKGTIKFVNNDFGKPSLINPPDLHFNISHSGDWVVCALDNKPLGVDVEQIKPINHKIGQRFFCPQEYKDLLAKPEEERDKYFYQIWTLKESYLKAKGQGLSCPINSFCFSFSPNGILLHPDKVSHPYFFWQAYLAEEYILALCTSQKYVQPNIKILDLAQTYSP